MDQLLEAGMFFHKNNHLYHHEQLVRLMAYNFLENKYTVKPPTLEGTSPEDLGLNDNIVKVAEVSVCDNNLVLCTYIHTYSECSVLSSYVCVLYTHNMHTYVCSTSVCI